MATQISQLGAAVQLHQAIETVGSSTGDGAAKKVPGEETDSFITKVSSGWIYAIAAVGIGSAFCSMALTASLLVDISCLTVMVVAPIGIAQKRKLLKLGTMREQQNHLRGSVNEMSDQNEKLKSAVTDLEAQADSIRDTLTEFKHIEEKYKGQVEKMSGIFEENGVILDKIKEALEAQVMQTVLDHTLTADTDKSMTLSSDELKTLKFKLSLIEGVHLNEENFDKVIGNGEVTLEQIMGMFRNLKDESVPDEDNVFVLEPEKLLKKKSFLGLGL